MHVSVLLEECIKYLNLNDKSIIVDCTLGYGGHSSAILKNISNGHLYSFDQDSEAILYSSKRLSEVSDNYTIINSNFVNLKQELNKLGINEVDGILYDLGVSSPQLDENLVRVLREYGEEKYASSIVMGIINSRPINTTLELVEVIKNNVPEKYRRDKHPARKTFQAIRIEVNNELNVFEDSLKQALDLIKVGGRVCVITFHSLEDKICKEVFRSVSSIDDSLKKLPVIPNHLMPKYKVVKVVEPSKEELDNNNRARSAKLRVIERIG